MRVLLDDIRLEVDRPTLAAALEAGRRAAEAQSRVVVEATVDDLPITDEELDSPGEQPRPEACVRFVTADPLELVRATLADAATALEGVIEDQRIAAEHLQTGRLEQAMERLKLVLETWESVRRVVSQGLALVGRSESETAVEAAGAPGSDRVMVADCTRALAGTLEEVQRTIRAKDWSGLADGLEYDLAAQARRWIGVLGSLAEQLEAERGR